MYLVIMKDKTSFITTWYEYEDHWSDDVFCVIILSLDNHITFDGKNWEEVGYDHL